ncbi:adenylate/guanylate cyclase domain-containing protein [Rheinheimera texasensis]|uniref:adenylate/guanylate cyclase domain-containing protein n=1 Tax=Rheinheimera texasensis TaxID=306205 RepID=UPI00068AC6DD|nr:adenylate/guanylate cyclase domain-containing protein [Rheinheimera texasensis]
MHTENLTILFVDIAGFTATTNRQSRRQNASLLQNFESLLKPQIKKFSGQLVKSIGDALLLTFRSPTDAMLCACRMQDRLALHHQQYPDEQPIVIRIAAHLGEVRTARHDIFGEAVNLASRIEAVTPPGEIYLSEAVFLAMNKTEVHVQSAGQFQLDGFDHPLHLYKVQQDPLLELPFGSSSTDLLPNNTQKHWRMTALVFITLLGVATTTVYLQDPPLAPAALPATTQRSSQYVTADLTAINDNQLPAEFRFGLQLAIEQAIQRIPGLYLAPEDGSVSTDYRLRVNLVMRVFPKPAELHFTLERPATPAKQQWGIQWSGQQQQQTLRQVQQQLIQLFSQITGVAALNTPPTDIDVPDSFYQQYLQARQWLQQGEQSQNPRLLQQSRDQLRHVVTALPEFRAGRQALCNAMLHLFEWRGDHSQLTDAAPYCQKLIEGAADSDDWLAYGRWLALQQDKQTAAKALLQALTTNPKSGQAYALLSRLYLQDNQPLEAELVLKRAVSLQPDYWPAIQLMAVFQLEQGQLQAAVANFKKVVLLAPENAVALTNLGSAYLYSGQLQAAADTYQAALQIQPEPFIQANLATVYYYLGRLQDAIALYQQALKTSPDEYEFHGNIADAYRQNQQPSEARLHYQLALRALEQKPTLTARELALKAHYLSASGDSANSQKQMKQALQQQQNNAETWLLDALMKARQGENSAALLSAKQAVRLGFPAKLLAVEPDLRALAADPQFLALLSQ